MALKNAFLVLCFCTTFAGASAQIKTLQLSLEEVVAMAQGESPSAEIFKTRLTNNYWRYQSFLANYKPQIDLDANLPGLSRSTDAYLLPDGRDIFLRQASLSNVVGVSLIQDIGLTGGRVFASTGLQHKFNFASDLNPSSTSYFSTPIRIGFFQPLFGFNNLKWDKKIEPVRYEEASRDYSEALESVALQAAQQFFEVYISQLNIQAAHREKLNADTLYKINVGRFEVGRIAETELLQIELQVNNAEANLAQAELDLQSSMENLRIYLGIKEKVQFNLLPPQEIPVFAINPETALQFARKNRSETLRLEREMLEADRDVALAKANSGVNASLQGSFGLSQTAGNIGDAYKNPQNDQRFNVGLNIPLADWGKARARLKIEESNRELRQKIVDQDQVNFEQEILLNVQQFDLVRSRVRLAQKAFDVAKKREDITRQRYLIGKIDITNLNLAIREREEARNRYTSALRSFWVAYYQMRLLTLYDFEIGQSLVKKLEGY